MWPQEIPIDRVNKLCEEKGNAVSKDDLPLLGEAVHCLGRSTPRSLEAFFQKKLPYEYQHVSARAAVAAVPRCRAHRTCPLR